MDIPRCPICNRTMRPYHEPNTPRYGKNQNLIRYICRKGCGVSCYVDEITKKVVTTERSGKWNSNIKELKKE